MVTYPLPSETTDDPIRIHNKVSFDILTNPSPFSSSFWPFAEPSEPMTSSSSDNS